MVYNTREFQDCPKGEEECMGMTGILYPQVRAKDGQNAGFSVPGTHKAEGRDGNLCSVPAFTARLRLRVKEPGLLYRAYRPMLSKGREDYSMHKPPQPRRPGIS